MKLIFNIGYSFEQNFYNIAKRNSIFQYNQASGEMYEMYKTISDWKHFVYYKGSLRFTCIYKRLI